MYYKGDTLAMESNSHPKIEEEVTNPNVNWTNFKQFQHRYLVSIPKESSDTQVEFGLPFPIFDPVQKIVGEGYKNVFKQQSKTDRRLEYFKKIHSKANKKLLKETIKENTFVSLPKYVVDVARGVFDDHEDHAWSYTGGTLDCFTVYDDSYIVRAGWKQEICVTKESDSALLTSINLLDESPVYNLKIQTHQECIDLAARQKHKISLYRLNLSDDVIRTDLEWKASSNNKFLDMSFNDNRKYSISTIDSNHLVKVMDWEHNKHILEYGFSSTDYFAQISYIDCDTLVYINRCCIYLLDLRSCTTKQYCLKTSWLKCDDLCTCSRFGDYLYISSWHSVYKVDIRSFKTVDRTMHMLSTPPFISSVAGSYVCLAGQECSDKVLLSDINLLPQYISNTKDTLTKTSLTRKISLSKKLDDRLSLPILGMKLHQDSSEINLYSVNTFGDVFKQTLTQNKDTDSLAIDRLENWINRIEYQNTPLKATSIAELSNVMHCISTRFPVGPKLNQMMEKSSTTSFFETQVPPLTKCLENSVGESLNAIWCDENDLTVPLSSQSKVSDWLDAVM